ncbi:succinylglutamate desuccinylase [Rouxiella badensis]|jgi:succinylglutamate desuccinylase|uniref:Succinylglutamate desuccinylase n=1 Tax=Rouxiella badensis TaxID=1646377 RepID=A0A1X0WGK8_9GAMM|nr:succinylglutamate desuccinylase [Rouxiella badensis]MCC3701540.1 succinylglutamate desuccinylase [Rouxiella badensis]MCC3719444.1 succinylglutamate desuccinylase [Rouxiella badensis]MCC3728694.1 succinylglutamate desuccinylase [Rouxiella badensis]MCC3734273.1 succinylglutamate desuccinylase [Rouxiella badensis]MCC3739310.1 succinylglutamate desuccinylase [Rouxiella badensis]
MFDVLTLTLDGTPPVLPSGQLPHLDWQWLAEGVLELSPRHACKKAVVLSAGVHGNETAPIELLNQLVAELLAGTRPLRVRLLVVLGNPPSMRANKRYLVADMNRMFGGRHVRFTPSDETRRAQQLEQLLAQFYRSASAAGARQRFHYDLHTAIRGSLYLRFGLLPFQLRPHSPEMLAWLEQAGLDALVYHRSPGGTFTHFSSEVFDAESCTLELGKALPFGENDLKQFIQIKLALQALVSDLPAPARQGEPMKHFQVVQDILREQPDFQLHVPADALNFTAYPQGYVLAEQSGKTYRVEHPEEVVLFPNPNVALGLRAGLMLVEMS